MRARTGSLVDLVEGLLRCRSYRAQDGGARTVGRPLDAGPWIARGRVLAPRPSDRRLRGHWPLAVRAPCDRRRSSVGRVFLRCSRTSGSWDRVDNSAAEIERSAALRYAVGASPHHRTIVLRLDGCRTDASPDDSGAISTDGIDGAGVGKERCVGKINLGAVWLAKSNLGAVWPCVRAHSRDRPTAFFLQGVGFHSCASGWAPRDDEDEVQRSVPAARSIALSRASNAGGADLHDSSWSTVLTAEPGR